MTRYERQSGRVGRWITGLIVTGVLAAVLLVAQPWSSHPAATKNAASSSTSHQAPAVAITRTAGDSTVDSHDPSYPFVHLEDYAHLCNAGEQTGCGILDTLRTGEQVVMRCWEDTAPPAGQTPPPEMKYDSGRWFYVNDVNGENPGYSGFVYSELVDQDTQIITRHAPGRPTEISIPELVKFQRLPGTHHRRILHHERRDAERDLVRLHTRRHVHRLGHVSGRARLSVRHQRHSHGARQRALAVAMCRRSSRAVRHHRDGRDNTAVGYRAIHHRSRHHVHDRHRLQPSVEFARGGSAPAGSWYAITLERFAADTAVSVTCYRLGEPERLHHLQPFHERCRRRRHITWLLLR